MALLGTNPSKAASLGQRYCPPTSPLTAALGLGRQPCFSRPVAAAAQGRVAQAAPPWQQARPAAVPAPAAQATHPSPSQPPLTPAVRTLHPPPTAPPLATGYLAIPGSPHALYYEVHGNPKGFPALVVHGGPGAGCYANHA